MQSFKKYYVILLLSLVHKGLADDGCRQQISASNQRQTLGSALLRVSQSNRVSIVAEIELGEVSLPSETMRLDTWLRSISSDIRCEVKGKTLHVFSVHVLNAAGNSLNHVFSYFEMPPDVDHFRLMLRSRLDREAFEVEDQRRIINPGSGYIAIGSSMYPLKVEVFHGMTARELLIQAASEQVFATVIEFPIPTSNRSPRQTWQFAEAHWLSVTPPAAP